MRVITLKPQPLTPESFAPFGNILNLDRSEIVCTEGVLTARITHAPLRDLSEERPHFLNRHMEETQIFVPLGGKDGLFFVGPPSETPDSFDPEKSGALPLPGRLRNPDARGHLARRPFAVTEPTDYINIQGDQVRHYTDGYDFKERDNLVFQFDLS